MTTLRDVRSILVIRFRHLGDAVLVMALFHNLRIVFPQAKLSILVDAVYAGFLADQPDIDRVFALPKGGDLGEPVLKTWSRLAVDLYRAAFDLVIDLSDTRTSYQITRLIHAPVRVGYSPPLRLRRHWWEGRAYNVFAKPLRLRDRTNSHVVESYLSPLRVLGLPVLHCRPKLFAPARDCAVVERLLAQAGLDRGPFALVHPGARKLASRWPPEQFAAVIDGLAERGLAVILIGGAEEVQVRDQIRTSTKAAFTDLVGQLSVGQLVALAGRCRLFIGNESGPMHVAAASGARIVAIFGANSPERWGPLCDSSSVVRPQMPCPCPFPGECRPPSPNECFCVRRNSVADVLGAIDADGSAAMLGH